jgi:hypothetical protein
MTLPSLASLLAFSLLGVCLPGCSSGRDVPTVDAAVDVGKDAPEDAGPSGDATPILSTAVCRGDTANCLSGTLALGDFTALPTAAKVTLYHVFPHGNVEVVASSPIAEDGTFAFSRLPAWSHYYLQGEVRFGEDASATAVASTVGSFSVPAPSKPIAIVVRPVFLEVLQEAPSGGSTLLSWASAHLYDPASGREVTHGSVSLTANGTSFPMPYGTNAGGTQSFNVNLPSGTPGGTSFTIVTAYAELGPTSKKWTLAGEPATFSGALLSPMGVVPVPAKAPLAVTWQAQPMASYSQTELFQQQGTSYVQRYVSPTVDAPNVTTETIPASALGSSGTYLLNEDYASATCPTTADGCVYNLSTAAVNLTVQ